jgi:glyoxylase-like metal-dependent hydrolase (beta-lactamase superfamily II)
MDDLEARLFPLPDDTRFYLGHGKDSTIGAERTTWRSGEHAAGDARSAVSR